MSGRAGAALEDWTDDDDIQERAELAVHRRDGGAVSATRLIAGADVTVPVTVQTPTALAPADAFRIIVPIDLSLVFRGWGPFPGMRGANNQTGAWDAAGQSRNPDLSDGSTAVERLTEYTAPSSFAYELSDFTGPMRRLVVGVRGEWTFAPDGDGTLIRWAYEFKPLPGRHLLLRRVVGPLWRNYMVDGITRSARAAEEIAASQHAG